jgi:hypothetical protein
MMYTMNMNIPQSLILLKKNAFSADFSVLTRLLQKLIKKNEVIPINSQPKTRVMKLPANNNVIILIEKKFISMQKLLICTSYFM